MTNTRFLRIGPLLIAGALAGCNNGPTSPASVATHTLSGTISEAGAGPIGGVSLTTDRGKAAITDEHGQYRIDGLSGLVNLTFTKSGYESEQSAAILDRDQVVNGTIRRVIHIAPGEITEVTVFRDDPDYDLAYAWCPGPCKKIQVTGPGGTAIFIRARARDKSRQVCLLVDGGPPYRAMPTCSTAEVNATTSLLKDAEFQIYVSFGDGYREGTQSVEVSVMLGTKP